MDGRRTTTVTGAILTALVIGGCSGSSGGRPPGSSSAPARSATSSPAPSSATTGGAPGQPAPTAVVKAVTAAYQVFFSSKSTITQSQASLQNGARFHATLVQQGKSQYASTSSARVLSVRELSPDVASVNYDILSNDQVLLQNVLGHAVRQNGRWVVAAETFCGLLRLQQQAPRACSDPSVTALPS